MSFFSGGFGKFCQISSTFPKSFACKASAFYLPLVKSLTTNTTCLGVSTSNNFKFNYKIIYNIDNWEPLNNPICWIHKLINKVWDKERANKEFLLSIFYK